MKASFGAQNQITMKAKTRISLSLVIAMMLGFIYDSAISARTDFPGAPMLIAEVTSHDFGAIEQNIPVEHTFYFTNTGEAPLLVTNIKTSCGCTAAEYTNEPLEMGEEGFIKVRYNAKSVGKFSKTVTVTANSEVPAPVFTIKGEVQP